MNPHAGKVLIVEDEPRHSRLYEAKLAPAGYRIETAADVETASAKLLTFVPDVVILDLRLERQESEEGLSFLRVIVQSPSDAKVIVITVDGTTETARKAIQLGAYDFIEKEKRGYNELPFRVNQAYERLKLERQVADFQRQEMQKVEGYRYGSGRIILGNSQSMTQLYRTVDQVAPTDATVLICGETGTGKGLVAQGIHHKSKRATKPFLTVACGTIPNELLASELFGHEKGAYTGASVRRQGKFELADGGTLFLDEVGEMDEPSQVKLLRVLQESQFERVGGNQTLRVDVRIIAATNKDFGQMIEEGTFREDLYYRLRVVQLEVPSLRERKSDTPLLAKHFLNEFNTKHQKKIKGFEEAAMRLLIGYSWPGNVRQLENCVEQAVILAERDWITTHDIQIDTSIPSDGTGQSLPEMVDEYEHVLIVDALERHQWSQNAAATELGISESLLRYKMKKYDLPSGRFTRSRRNLK